MEKNINLKNFNRAKGFTLIELLVVVSLIGVLATLVLANLNAARQRGRDAERKADSRNIQTALRLYYNDAGGFPESNASYQMVACDGTACSWDSGWDSEGITYMQILPGDPISTQTYRYAQIDADSYTIDVCLENKSDDSGQVTSDTSWCSTGWMYRVIQ